MKHLDWQMVLFVGASLIHDYWVTFGLPHVQYWDIRKEKNIRVEGKVN